MYILHIDVYIPFICWLSHVIPFFFTGPVDHPRSRRMYETIWIAWYRMIVLGMVSLSSISFHGATWSLPYQKTTKQLPSSRLRLTPNGSFLFFQTHPFSHISLLKSHAWNWGRCVLEKSPQICKCLYKLVAWNLYVGRTPCWSYPLLSFFWMNSNFPRLQICHFRKVYGCGLGGNLEFARELWLLATCILLEFCFKNPHLIYFLPVFFRLCLLWLAPTKRILAETNFTNQGHRLQSLGAFLDHPVYPAVVSKFDTGWSYSGRTQGTQGTQGYNMSCFCKVGWMLKIRWNGRLRRMKMMMEPRPSTDRNGRLGHWQLSMPFIANLFSSDSAEPCRFFPPWWSNVLPTLCWANVCSKRLQIIASIALKKADSPAVKKKRSCWFKPGWACLGLHTVFFFIRCDLQIKSYKSLGLWYCYIDWCPWILSKPNLEMECHHLRCKTI